MARTAVRDVVIWVKHIHGDDVSQRVLGLRGGETLDLLVDGVAGSWRKMDDGRDGRPTTGIRPIGRMQDFWRELYASRRGDVVTLELCQTNGELAMERSNLIFAPLARTEETRRSALEAFLNLKDAGYGSTGAVITRDDMHDRELDREGL
ncbi:hypothetical protein BH10PSE4_BH10PSE4_29250 [soil metagenome]